MNTKSAFPSDAADKVLVRMPDGMRDQLKESAKASNRTMNAEIVSRLQTSFAPQNDTLLDQLPEVLRQAIDEIAHQEGVGKLEALEAVSVRAAAYSAVPVIIIHYGHTGVPLKELRQFIHDALHDAPAECSIYVMK